MAKTGVAKNEQLAGLWLAGLVRINVMTDMETMDGFGPQ